MNVSHTVSVRLSDSQGKSLTQSMYVSQTARVSLSHSQCTSITQSVYISHTVSVRLSHSECTSLIVLQIQGTIAKLPVISKHICHTANHTVQIYPSQVQSQYQRTPVAVCLAIKAHLSFYLSHCQNTSVTLSQGQGTL